MNKTSASPLPRMWAAWLLVMAAVILAAFALMGRTPAAKTQLAVASPNSPEAQPVTPSRTPPASPAAAAPEPRSPMEAIQARAEQRAARAKSRQQYWEEGFAAQGVNPAWAAREKQAILDLLRSGEFAAAKPDNLTVECRTSVCKLGASFDSVAAGQDWIELVTLHSGGFFTGGATNLQAAPDGTAQVRVFVQPRG